MQRRFTQVDVFSEAPLGGNPLAVVIDADGLDDAAMQRFANWTNLSETTFLLPPTQPEADYRVRIFTPSTELPFAGHPTLGSCHAWLEAGGSPKRADVIVQECGAGLISIRRDGQRLAFAAPPMRKTGPLDDALLNRLIVALGLSRDDVLDHQWLVNGPNWIGLYLRSAELVLAAKPNFESLKGLDFGLVGPHPPGSACAFEVRAFAYFDGHIEDPVTGSLNAGIAQWLIGQGIAPDHYIAAQGTALGRSGRIHVDKDAEGGIWIGGLSRTVVSGQVDL
jgi:PhzF family phenazine biosynthesis protein